jgi:hypothetical protein
MKYLVDRVSITIKKSIEKVYKIFPCLGPKLFKTRGRAGHDTKSLTFHCPSAQLDPAIGSKQ